MKSVESRYVYQVNPNWFIVKKFLDGDTVYFGGFTNLDEAKKHRDYCIEHDWSLDCVKSKRDDEMRYLSQLPSNKYVIYKNLKVDGEYRTVYFGVFECLSEAKEYRDYCIEHEWDIKLCKRRYSSQGLPKYITRQDDGFIVQRRNYRTGEGYSQRFKTLEDAVRERNLLIQCDWDEDELIGLDECYGSDYDGGPTEHLL